MLYYSRINTHTNTVLNLYSKWIKNSDKFKERKVVTPQGFEPWLTGSKPVVLPLHNGVSQSYGI